MKIVLVFIFSIFIITGVLFFSCVPNARKYVNAFLYKNLEVDSTGLPLKNKLILNYASEHGHAISPTYQKAVCTEYVIGIVSHFVKLSTKTKNEIRIITNQPIEDLLKYNSPITKGVYTALINNGVGVSINNINEVKAGDFFQYWDKINGNWYGHCGIVRALDTKKGIISMYSSTNTTNGHGIQTYILPSYIYFVRLK